MDTPFDTRAQRWRNRAKLLYLRPWSGARQRWEIIPREHKRTGLYAAFALAALGLLMWSGREIGFFVIGAIAISNAVKFAVDFGILSAKDDETENEMGIEMRDASLLFLANLFLGVALIYLPIKHEALVVTRILGIDPGTLRAGYGVITFDSPQPNATWGTLRPGTKDDPVAHRLGLLWRQLEDLFSFYEPDVLAIERVFIGRNPHAGMQIARAQALAMTAAGTTGIPVFEYAASQVKAAVGGKGNASKSQVRAALAEYLTPEVKDATDDASDALAIAYCHTLRQAQQRANQPRLV